MYSDFFQNACGKNTKAAKAEKSKCICSNKCISLNLPANMDVFFTKLRILKSGIAFSEYMQCCHRFWPISWGGS